ncbi:MAG: hypothetical protein EB127_12015 [Alphaproteobacteria bacterium]|nr:hypothetical protein [Alphaproteobacteria bacterium]
MENVFMALPEDVSCILPFDSAPFQSHFDRHDRSNPYTVREYFYYTGVTGPTGKPHAIEFHISENSGAFKSKHSELNNPSFYLMRGFTYHFKINSPGHPFWISLDKSHPPRSLDRIVNNGTDNGTIEFNVPMDFTEDLYYICGLHACMSGCIFITDCGPTGPTGPSDGPTGPIGPTGPSFVPNKVYLQAYNSGVQTIYDGSAVTFDTNGCCSGECFHSEGSGSIYVWKTGVYSLSTQIYSLNGCQFSMMKNNSIIDGSTTGTLTGSTQNMSSVICEITDSDILPYADSPTGTACKFELVNTGSSAGVVLLYDASSIGFSVTQSNANFLLVSL